MYQLTYQLHYMRHGVDLVLPADTLPPQVSENLVTTRGRWRAYEWAEANKVEPWMTKSAWIGLMREADAEYKRLLRDTRRDDRQGVNNFASTIRRGWSFPNLSGWYNSISGQANPGQPY